MAVESYMPYYQPQVDMRSGELVGMEAVARGMDAAGRVVLPEMFETELEKEGGMGDLDLRIFEQVVRRLRDWKEHSPWPYLVTCRLSPGCLASISNVDSLCFILSMNRDVPAELIGMKVELPQGVPCPRPAAVRNIQSLYWSGLRIVTRYRGTEEPSSLFCDLPVYQVVLDKCLVDGIENGEEEKKTVEKACIYYREQGIPCVAEGVETADQAMALVRAGCIYGQGGYYSDPLPAREFEDRYLIRSRGRGG